MSEPLLQQILAELQGIKSDISELKHDVTELKHDVGELKHDVSQLKQEVAGIKNEVAEINTRLTHVESEIDDLKETTSRIETKQQIIFEQTGNLAEYHTDLQEELHHIKDRLQFTTVKLTENEFEIFKLKKH